MGVSSGVGAGVSVDAVEGEPFRSGVRQRWWMRKRIGLVTVGALTMVAALTTATALVTNLDGGIAAARARPRTASASS